MIRTSLLTIVAACLTVGCAAFAPGRFSLSIRGHCPRLVSVASNRPVEEPGELDRLMQGVDDIKTGAAFDGSKLSSLLTPEDIVGSLALVPLAVESLRTAITGQTNVESYVVCAATTLLAGIAHAKMSADIPRDYRAPRLAEYNSVYEFSALYLFPFSWLLLRMTSAFPQALEFADPFFCVILSAVTIYGFAYAGYGKGLLEEANREGYQGVLQPSDAEYQAQAQLYLTGNLVINGLACLFLPFAWTLAFRGTEWWEQVQVLHPNQGAFIGVSVLVAIIGDVSGNLLLRLKELGLIRSQPGIVVMGIVSNFLLLIFPEIVFNSIYNSGVSELGFYWE